jgi:hypothetical protein
VGASNRRVPIRPDLKRDPLDLMEFGPPRSFYTGSIKRAIWAV